MEQEYTQFYRCLACHKALEMTEHLKKGNTACPCGGKRFNPTRLTRWELTKYLATHPSVVWETLKDRSSNVKG